MNWSSGRSGNADEYRFRTGLRRFPVSQRNGRSYRLLPDLVVVAFPGSLTVLVGWTGCPRLADRRCRLHRKDAVLTTNGGDFARVPDLENVVADSPGGGW